MTKPVIAVHKFSSCDGCQLAFINAGEALIALTEMLGIKHFAEAGPVDPDVKADIAFVEGSISTPHEAERIKRIRDNSKFLITIGACATAGGIQSLRNLKGVKTQNWVKGVYAHPEYIDTLDEVIPVADLVKVDFELWGCPVDTRQVVAAVRSLLFGVMPFHETEKVCMACKRSGTVCTMVTKGKPCMGPVTRTGCGALCPKFGRDCYGCYGPTPENANTTSLANRFEGLGLMPDQVARRFEFINYGAPAFRDASDKIRSEQEGKK